jgi:A/G-specific adenine glycosylase
MNYSPACFILAWMQIDFGKKLLEWNRFQNNRSMPWKGERDPYRIWLSEIILQQTRVEQGMAYYEKFISVFPTIRDLASAPEKEVFKNWEGLGYYSRCRNLIATAKKIISEHNGLFPTEYAEILALPGVGPYTAAAIASFAFGLPYAVVDGNVERVIARYFGISAAQGSGSGKKLFTAIAGELMNSHEPAVYNQAIMDFGATVCKPKNPLCSECVQAKNCQAFQQGWTNLLPLKTKAAARKNRWLTYFIVEAGKDRFWIRERTAKDIWQNLYEFVLWETGNILPQDELSHSSFYQDNFGKKGFKILNISPTFQQTLTHQSVKSCFIHVKRDKPLDKLSGYLPVSRKQLPEFPFPKIITGYLKNSGVL